MALKRIERKPLKESGGSRKMEAGGIAKRRLLNSALDFVQNEEDILADLPEISLRRKRTSRVWRASMTRSTRRLRSRPT
jgi:hypothetical protein